MLSFLPVVREGAAGDSGGPGATGGHVKGMKEEQPVMGCACRAGEMHASSPDPHAHVSARRQARIDAIAAAAADWRAPDHPPREAAVADTLAAPNRWTKEAIDYALNRWMQRLTPEALTDWLGDAAPAAPTTVGVLHGSSGPLVGLRDAVAIWADGHTCLGHTAEASPALLPAFGRAVSDRTDSIDAEFVEQEPLLERAAAVTAQPARDDAAAVRAACDDHGIADDRRLVRPTLLAVAVLDGHEGDDALGGLAEDALLYDGGGHRRLALLWAPGDLSPDAYLEAMARFRGVFPAHEDTPGALQMQKAFLEARDEPRAYAEGLEFLMSRGEPKVPRPDGHLRWTQYTALDAVDEWITTHRSALAAVVAREPLHDQLPASWPLRTPGDLHLPPLANDAGRALADFLRALR